ncbi:major facilitator superfamily domain-containing protein [Microdochium bolleyi]|uniref:Major facilitator superfamily domain-containing protein n=1 Tax=Microdochium bolleyi TaxID=196109 RepID=A0A136JDG7_9PEZI|nr:major facilitator superfamily domain-containing protein [Microdochium bolleyi]
MQSLRDQSFRTNIATMTEAPGQTAGGQKMPPLAEDATPTPKQTNLGGLYSQDVSTARVYCLYIGISIGLFLAFLEAAIVATSLFHIGAEFQSLQELNWVALAYTLSYLALAVLSAQISDVIGRRNAFLIFYLIFIGFSLACGFAKTLPQLIAFRALQGVGGSGLYSIGMICSLELAPPKLQQFTGALIGLIITLSSVAGPVLGGALTEFASWRWIFWINGPIGALSTGLAFLAWPTQSDQQGGHRKRRWGEIDYVGSVLLISAVVLVVFSFQNAASQPDQWSQAVFLVPLILGLSCLAALLGWSQVVAKYWKTRLMPALPLHVLRNSVYTSALLNTVLLGFVYIMIIFAFPLRSQIVNGKSAMIAGLLLIPMLFANAIGVAVSTVLLRRRNNTTAALMLAAGLTMVGTGLLTTLSSEPELEAKAFGFLVFVGLGFGISISTTTMTAALEPNPEDHASAQGLIAQLRVLGGSLGIAASSAVLGTKLGPELAHVSPDQLVSASITPSALETVRQLASDAYRINMQVCTIVAGLAAVTALASWRRAEESETTRRSAENL